MMERVQLGIAWINYAATWPDDGPDQANVIIDVSQDGGVTWSAFSLTALRRGGYAGIGFGRGNQNRQYMTRASCSVDSAQLTHAMR